MTTIKATCPDCGDVDLSPADVTVTDLGTSASFDFGCPVCQARVSRPAGRAVVALLAGAGVTVRQSAVSTAPPLTPDDLLDFALALADCQDVLAALFSAPRR